MKTKHSYLEFKRARKLIRSLKLKNSKEWKDYSSTRRPNNVPANPSKIYKDHGWIDTKDWFGIQGHGRFKFSINDNYFKKWSHNMAYILGLWFADGCITSGDRFNITLHVDDKYLLEKILREMESDHQIAMKTNTCCMFTIVSKEIVRDIIRLGGKYRKSLDVKFPIIPVNYLPDFIRGLWDGDGSIWYCNAYKIYKSSICSGSKDFLLRLYQLLNKNISDFRASIHKTIVKRGSLLPNNAVTKRRGILYSLNLSVNNTIRLRDYIYKNKKGLKMIRKYNKFKKCGKIRTISRWDRNFVTFKNFKVFIKQNGFKKYKEWRAYLETHQRPSNIPAAPEVIYKKDWVGWKKVLNYS